MGKGVISAPTPRLLCVLLQEVRCQGEKPYLQGIAAEVLQTEWQQCYYDDVPEANTCTERESVVRGKGDTLRASHAIDVSCNRVVRNLAAKC